MTPAEALGLALSLIGAVAKIIEAREQGKAVNDAKAKEILIATLDALDALVKDLPTRIAADNALVDAEREAASSIIEAAARAADEKDNI